MQGCLASLISESPTLHFWSLRAPSVGGRVCHSTCSRTPKSRSDGELFDSSPFSFFLSRRFCQSDTLVLSQTSPNLVPARSRILAMYFRFLQIFFLCTAFVVASHAAPAKGTKERRRVRTPEPKLQRCVGTESYSKCMDNALKLYHCCLFETPGDQTGKCAIDYAATQDDCYEVAAVGCGARDHESCCLQMFTRYLPKVMAASSC